MKKLLAAIAMISSAVVFAGWGDDDPPPVPDDGLSQSKQRADADPKSNPKTKTTKKNSPIPSKSSSKPTL